MWGALVGAAPLAAQQMTSMQIGSKPEGARFYVDGQLYQQTTTFTWPVGSKHIVEFPVYIRPEDNAPQTYQLSFDLNYQYYFNGWEVDGGTLTPASALVQTVTATPSVRSLFANVTIWYRVNLQLLGNPQLDDLNPVLCNSVLAAAPGEIAGDAYLAGIAYFGSGCYISGNQRFFLQGGDYVLNAFPLPGFVFNGWSYDGLTPDAFLATIKVDRPLVLAAHFQRAKRVRFRTDPPGMQVTVNGSTVPTSSTGRVVDLPPVTPQSGIAECEPDYLRLPPGAPQGIRPLCFGEFDLRPGSINRVSVPTPQVDRNGRADWVFDSWSNGLGQDATFVADDNVVTPLELTARFVRGVRTSVRTEPAGLKLIINGRDTTNTNFVWAPNTRQTLSAPEIVDYRGRKYRFLSWSNGGARTQEITVPNTPDAGFEIAARFELLGQAVIQTVPPGLSVVVDGTECRSPCTIDRPQGTEVQFIAPVTQPVSETQRLEFVSWGSVATRVLSYRFSQEATGFTANYRSAFRVITLTDPPDGGDFRLEPPSPDGFYAVGSAVRVSFTAKEGFRFRKWDVDLAGSAPEGTVTVNLAKVVIALLDVVPVIRPAGIRNAAGDTPEPGVAPGSIISIFGENLAPALEVGRPNPLQQALQGITVDINDRWLPLLFVSPQQINAQLPSDLAEGEQTLRVRRLLQGDVTGRFSVVRNAPGLYSFQHTDRRLYALAQREGGEQIDPQRPARRGELIRIYGNGLGPYNRPAPDGFQVADGSQYRLADRVEVLVGEQVVDPVFAGAASGLVGTQTIQFRVPNTLPPGSVIPVSVRVNGKVSNVVILPVATAASDE
jgi:uncharacterized protein (TIGR03437 family)